MDGNTRDALIALIGPIGGVLVGILIANVGLGHQRELQKDRWDREDAARRRDRDLKSLEDTYAQVDLELNVALALALNDRDKADRLDALRGENPHPANDLGLLGEDSDEIYQGLMRLAGMDSPLTAMALRGNLRALAWQRIQRQRALVESGQEPERATRADWEQMRQDLLEHIRHPA